MSKRRFLLPVDKAEAQGDVMFYRYTKPFTKPKDGHGFIGTLSYDPAADKVQCHVCGVWSDYLYYHIRKEHELDAEAYKEKFGLLVTSVLTNERIRLRMVEKALDRQPKSRANRERVNAKLRKNCGRGHRRRGRTPCETQNRRGTCPAQLIQKIQALAKTLGHTPSIEEARGTVNWGTAKFLFGSWSELCRQAKLPHTAGKGDRHYHWIPTETLLLSLKRFWKEHGRPPGRSDGERGLMATEPTYRARFGSMLAAVEAAGINPEKWWKAGRTAGVVRWRRTFQQNAKARRWWGRGPAPAVGAV